MLIGEEGETIAQKGAEFMLDWRDIWKQIEIALLRLKEEEVEAEDEEGRKVYIKTGRFVRDEKSKPLVTDEGLDILYSEVISIVNKNTFLGKLRRDEALKVFQQIVDRLNVVLVANYDVILYPEKIVEVEVEDERGRKVKIKRNIVNLSNIKVVANILYENIYMALNRAIDGHTSEMIKTIQKIEERVLEREMEKEEKKKRFGIF